MDDGSTFHEMLRDWREVQDLRVSSWRSSYLREVDRVAESLRPRFASGELRAFTYGELQRGAPSPYHVVERLCCEHFRLEERDEATLRLLIDVSPHGRAMAYIGWTDDVFWVQAAIAWDVIALAREREMYVPAPDECCDPASLA